MDGAFQTADVLTCLKKRTESDVTSPLGLYVNVERSLCKRQNVDDRNKVNAFMPSDTGDDANEVICFHLNFRLPPATKRSIYAISGQQAIDANQDIVTPFLLNQECMTRQCSLFERPMRSPESCSSHHATTTTSACASSYQVKRQQSTAS